MWSAFLHRQIPTMRFILIILCILLASTKLMAQTISTPDQVYGDLFTDVQLSKIFPDSKTFVDCIPKKDPKQIVAAYKAIKNNPRIRFSLKLFIEDNFELPPTPASLYVTTEKNIRKHISNLWTTLRRNSDTVSKGGSLLPLPYDYIVPGGRFREIYYWDSYFTLLGLKESGQYGLMESMVKNFAFLIDKYGHMPNGNRTYYLSRSQPPYFSLMLDLLASVKGDDVYATYRTALEKEYNYWMDKTAGTHHVVKMPNGSRLNRYWDRLSIPRQEAYLEDLEVVKAKKLYPETAAMVYKNLRSAAESGWDFSSRWFADGQQLGTIQTTSLVPVDLNCLLYHLEQTLDKAYARAGKKNSSFAKAAAARLIAIRTYCWSPANTWYVDYNIRTNKQSSALTLAGMYPFFLQMATAHEMNSAGKILQQKFLKAGGVVTTLVNTGQQWDAPNGWAPLQWVTIMGLVHYGGDTLAKEIASRWITLNKKVFDNTGKLVERYDVVNADRPGGGGEYPSQDGFGWTNGVLLALMHQFNLE